MTRDFEWLRSPFCSNGACVEVFWAGRCVNVRDSKLSPASPIQRWEPIEWRGLLAAIRDDANHPGIDFLPSGHVRLGFEHSEHHEFLTFTAAEWAAFERGVRAGVFDLDKLSSPAPSAQQEADGAGRSAGLDGTGEPSEAATGAGMAGSPPAPVAAEHGPATGAADAAVGRPRRDSGAAASPSPTSAPVAADLGLPPGQASSRIEVRAGHDLASSVVTPDEAGEPVPAGGSPTLCGPNGFAPIVPAGRLGDQMSPLPPQEAVRPGPGPFVPTDLFAPTVEEVEELAAVLAEASRSYALLADGGEPSALVVARYLLAAGYVRAAVMPPPEVTEHWCQVVTGPAWGSGPLVEHISDIESSRGDGDAVGAAGSVPAQSGVGDVEGSAGPGLAPRGPGPADSTARAFHLGDVLSVTTGLLVSNRHMDGVHDVLDWMTGDSLFTHQLPRAVDEAKPEILRQHPDLADVPVPVGFAGTANVEAWLAEQVARFGEYRELTPMPAGDHAVIDPITELRMMAPDKPIIVVQDGTS